jgi:toxin ParE1/3/4
MNDLIWSERSVEDLQAIRRFWVPRDPNLVVALDHELASALAFILENPRAGSSVGRSERRKWRVGRTPFLLFYTFRSGSVRIGRIRHERENWRKAH